MAGKNTDKKTYVLKADTGHFRLTGGNVTFRTTTGSSSRIANTALIAAESLRSPGETTVIVPRPTDQEAVREPDVLPANAIVVSPHFKWLLIAVIAITVVCGAVQVLLAVVLDKPTELQQQAFAAMNFGWQAGLGALFGLLGGKATS
jgi:hypothetical protein